MCRTPPRSVEDEPEEDQGADHLPEERRVGPRRKSWADLGQKQKKRRSDLLFKALKRTAARNDIEPVQMVGTLLQR